jgi:hypothetical protein
MVTSPVLIPVHSWHMTVDLVIVGLKTFWHLVPLGVLVHLSKGTVA